MGELLQNLEAVYKRWDMQGPRKGGGSSDGSLDAVSDRASANYDRLMQKGRKSWSDRFGDYKRPQRRQKQPRNLPQGPEYDPLSSLGEFKAQPILQSCHVTCRRPMMGRCCECLVVSKKNFYTDDAPLAGFKDILRVDQSSSERNLLVRSVCHLIHALTRDQSHKYPDVTDDVINGMRVEEAVERTAAQLSGHDLGLCMEPRLDTEFEQTCRKCRQTVVKILRGMKATTTNWLIRLTGWALLKILGSLLNALVVHQGHMDMVRKAYKKNAHIPLVFLPLHRSHLDYIILTFVLWNWNVQAPYVAAGDNLNIPFFRWLLKGLGGFFIRRKLDRDTGRKDLLYRAVLSGYMSELLRRGENLEFFLEGGRSRSGRVLHPKAGLLSVVTDTFLEGTIPDAYLVPVSISYERIVDGDFTSEQMGESKKKETFWRAMKAIFRVLRTNFGNVRVDLGQPFSLQEYYSVVKATNRMLEDSASSQSDRSIPADQSEAMVKNESEGRLSGSNTSLYGTDVLAEEQRTLVQGLAEHVVYNSMKTTAVMCTNLVAYLLLTKFRKGVSLEELVVNVDWLREEITCRGRDVGFSGSSCDVIQHAVSILGSQLVTVRRDVTDNVTSSYLVPCLQVPDVLDLAYYANVAAMVFTLDSVIATSILASCEDDLTVCGDQKVKVSKETIMTNAEFLTTLLKYEFLMTPPCTPIQTALVETVESFVNKQLLISPQDEYEVDRSRTSRPTQNFQFNSDSEDDDVIEADVKYEVECGSTDYHLWYPLLWTTLAPVIEAYWVTACCLPRLLQQDMEETEFIKLVHDVARRRVEDGFASFAESMAQYSIKNAVLCYQHMKITEIYTINGLKMVSLCDSYTCQDALNDLVARVEKFRL